MLRRKDEIFSQNGGFSRLEIASVVVIIVIFGVVAWFWYSSYQFKIKTSEVKTNLQLIFDAEVLYYQHSQPSNQNTSLRPLNTKQFLPLSPQPAKPQPTPQFGNFAVRDWALLNVSPVQPMYYSYSVETQGTGSNAMFKVIARGDLDGDGQFSRWEIVGRVNPNEEILGRELIYSLDPLE